MERLDPLVFFLTDAGNPPPPGRWGRAWTALARISRASVEESCGPWKMKASIRSHIRWRVPAKLCMCAMPRYHDCGDVGRIRERGQLGDRLLTDITLTHPDQHRNIDAGGLGRDHSGQDQCRGQTGNGCASPDRSRLPYRMPAGEISLDERLGNVFPEERVPPIRRLDEQRSRFLGRCSLGNDNLRTRPAARHGSAHHAGAQR